MYGNLPALATIEAMAEAESRRGASVAVVFNGDFNFFNAHESDFRELNRRILFRPPSPSPAGFEARGGGKISFLATAGNIELAIAGGAAGTAGCGCDYPAYVSQDIVRRSDLIVERLGELADKCSKSDAEGAEIVRTLASLPLFETLEVAGRRIGIIHGDPQMLSGWSFGVELMTPPDESLRASLGCADTAPTPISLIHRWFAEAQVDIFACTHTCLPFAQRFRGAGGAGWYGHTGEADGIEEGSRASQGHGAPAAQKQCEAEAAAVEEESIASGDWKSDGVIFNNGSAGMANFAGRRWGLITRISADLQLPPASIYGSPASIYGCVLPAGARSAAPGGVREEKGAQGRLGDGAGSVERGSRKGRDVRIDAVKVEFDNQAFEERFVALWPPGSPAFER